ncbi:DUF2254 domain-containing protein [Pontibacillus yanchengensis]|uniref:DUF2254 domain-containing protein n=1 Tax=Pontibacillus yanchengensis TaxID=462910 RepID=A0A6I4ZY46_9BACI|nr:DUF2254 domain-containing protein [Pontibacillus yanchengensis]MYL35018.1 DUF2254 domain-containing protein [Pontibacillus yanchengensis]
MRNTRLWLSVRDSFWFVPLIYGILSIVGIALTKMLDLWFMPFIEQHVPTLFLGKRSMALYLYSSLITAMLTMTTISFSSIMVVLTTYSSQFSPRALEDFMTDRITQNVLGVYVFGFMFSLGNLLLLPSSKTKLMISPFFTVLVTACTLAFFVWFIHHSARWVQVNNLIGKIQNETIHVINRKFSEKAYGIYEEWNQEEIKRLNQKEKHYMKAKVSGYVQHIDFRPFINWAQKNNVFINVNVQVGDYVESGSPIFYYQFKDGEENLNEDISLDYVIIGKERTNVQDIEFSIQKLVEIALRAISPGINDPHTAINCINRIGSLLAELGHKHKPFRYYTDKQDELRLIVEPKSYHQYLYKSFYQIRLYGKNDVSVMNGILESLYKIALVNEEHIRKDIWSFTIYILDAIKDEDYHQYDLDLIRKTASNIAELCNEEEAI